jgi:hypothetical protein
MDAHSCRQPVVRLLVPVGSAALWGEVVKVPDRFEGADVAGILPGVLRCEEQFRAPEVADCLPVTVERALLARPHRRRQADQAQGVRRLAQSRLRRRSRARHRAGRLRLGPAAGRRCTGGTTAVRKITAGLFITLDGVVEAPEKWNPPYYDDELGQAVMPQLMDVRPASVRAALLRAVPGGIHRTGRATAREADDRHPEGCRVHHPGPSPAGVTRR